MTKFTKFTLILVAIVAGAAITVMFIGQAYEFRGGFSIGGEWLVLPIVIIIKQLVKEARGVFKNLYGGENG